MEELDQDCERPRHALGQADMLIASVSSKQYYLISKQNNSFKTSVLHNIQLVNNTTVNMGFYLVPTTLWQLSY